MLVGTSNSAAVSASEISLFDPPILVGKRVVPSCVLEVIPPPWCLVGRGCSQQVDVCCRASCDFRIQQDPKTRKEHDTPEIPGPVHGTGRAQC